MLIVRGLEVAVAAVVDTCAVETKELGEMAEDVLDLAWKVGLDRARKAEKMFAKKGRLVGILNPRPGWSPARGSLQFWFSLHAQQMGACSWI